VKCFVFGFESSLGLRRCGRTMCGKYGLTGASGIECRFSPNVLVRWPHLRDTSTDEWIDNTHAGVHEISTISRGDRQTVDDRSRRDEAILDRHGFSGCAKARQQFRPLQPRVRVPGKTVETPDPRVEPAFQGSSVPSLRKDENPESKFAENDGIDGNIRLMCAKPRHDPRIGRRFRRLAQDVSVDQVLHSASVDSESIGTKKSFCGQSSSQSTAPSFGGAVRRTRR